MEKHYKSDFALSVELRDREGNPLGVPTWPFKVEVYTNGAKKVVAECKIEPKGDGGYEMVCTDNLVLGDPIVVSANNHGLMPGRVKMLIYNNTPNALYEDGYEQNTIFVETDLELTATPSDVSEEDTQVSVEAVLPFAVVTAYDMAVRNGYRGTQEEWEAALRDLPFAVQQAYIEANNAGSAAAAANAAATHANDKANAAETAAANANEAAGRAEAAQALANRKAAEAGEAARLATSAASSAGRAIGSVETKMQAIDREWGEKKAEMEEMMPTLAKTDRNNNFGAAQTVNGTLTVNGDIVQLGQSYITEAEHVETKDSHITLRKGAVGGLGNGESAGLEVDMYDGENDGVMELGADGVLRVGDKGDAQPLLTRAEASQLQDGDLLVWDAANQRAVPMGVDIIDMEVTYDDDSTEVFKVVCKRQSNGGE